MRTTLVTGPAIYPVSLAEAKDQLHVTHSDDDARIKSLISTAVASVESCLARKLITQTWKMFLDSWPPYIKVFYGDLQSVTHVKYTDTDETTTTFSTDYYDVDTDSVPGRINLKYGESWPSDLLNRTSPIEVQFITGYTYDSTVKEPVFDGVGLDDIETSGTYSGTSPALFEVKVQTAGDTDVIKWRKNGGAWTSNVNITGAAQSLSDGVSVTFAATTGHTADERWEFYAGLTVPEPIRQAIFLMVSHHYGIREPIIVGTITSKVKYSIDSLLSDYRVWDWVL